MEYPAKPQPEQVSTDTSDEILVQTVVREILLAVLPERYTVGTTLLRQCIPTLKGFVRRLGRPQRVEVLPGALVLTWEIDRSCVILSVTDNELTVITVDRIGSVGEDALLRVTSVTSIMDPFNLPSSVKSAVNDINKHLRG
jgi:hypothetical protein